MSEFNIKRYKELESTQAKAKEFNEPWTVVVSESQSEGKGKDTNVWYSPIGSLYFSVVLPKTNLDDLQAVTILVAFVVSKILKEKYYLEPMIKLPNDIYVEGKKICGILTQNVIEGNNIKNSVIGIGLNTNTEEFRDDLNATSIYNETGIKVDNQLLLDELLIGLKKLL